MQKHLILGATGFLGTHLEYRLKERGDYVVSVARQPPYRRPSVADQFEILELTNPSDYHHHFYRHHFDGVWQLAAETGGLGYIGVGDHDADILTRSLKINLYTLEAIAKTQKVDRIFFASSQCVYPDNIPYVDPFACERIPPPSPQWRECDASFDTFAFGQEKLYAEKLYAAYARRYGLNVRIGRIGNTYGPYCTWGGDRAKSVGAICRKVAEASYGGTIDIWGGGEQTRSFTYVDDTVDGITRLMASDYTQPVNIAHSEQTSILDLFGILNEISGKALHSVSTDDGPIGVSHRGSNNTLCREVLGWEPMTSLYAGLEQTYPWIEGEVQKALTKLSA